MNILITGGAGFIGSNLAKVLLKNNKNKVVVFDNFLLGTPQNIEEFKSNKNFIFFKIDVTDIDGMIKILDNLDFKIDIIYHLSANSDIKKGVGEPQIDYKNTFLTTFSILEIARIYKIKNFFFSSTSAVYGNIADIKLSENQGGLMPVSYYGGSKLAGEAFISAYTHMNNMNTIIFRFPNVIGPKLTHGVILDFKNKLEANKNCLEILGDGKQEKPYIYVIDLVEEIIEMTKEIKEGVEIYNIGVEDEISVERIAKIICEEMGLKDVEFKYTGGNIGWKGDVPKFSYDISKLKNTGWFPKKNSEEAVRLTIKSLTDGK